MENKTHAVCQECGQEFDYILKPGFPRKYCPECSAKKKQEYADANIEVVKPGLPEHVPIAKGVGLVLTKPGAGREANVKRAYEAGTTENKHLTMYVSYAKDIFVSLVKESSDENMTNVMKMSTELVKQAMQELS